LKHFIQREVREMDTVRRLMFGIAVAGAIALASAGASATWEMESGFDLLQTGLGTHFGGIALTGAPDFITSPGCRLAQYRFKAEVPGISPPKTDTITLEIAALGLRSVDPWPGFSDPLEVRLPKDMASGNWAY
jgi:hypothetical protein